MAHSTRKIISTSKEWRATTSTIGHHLFSPELRDERTVPRLPPHLAPSILSLARWVVCGWECVDLGEGG